MIPIQIYEKKNTLKLKKKKSSTGNQWLPEINGNRRIWLQN
jgi:hypothetical protein